MSWCASYRRASAPSGLKRAQPGCVARSAVRSATARWSQPPYRRVEKHHANNSIATMASATLLLGACALGPNYIARLRPRRRSSRTRNHLAFVPQTPEAVWWHEFDDAELDGPSRARARCEFGTCEARTTASGPPAPCSSRGSSTTRRTCSSTGRTRRARNNSPDLVPISFNIQSASLGFDAAWELDLFGRVRRSVEAARADLGAESAQLSRR